MMAAVAGDQGRDGGQVVRVGRMAQSEQDCDRGDDQERLAGSK
jgi:hypothetical protein